MVPLMVLKSPSFAVGELARGRDLYVHDDLFGVSMGPSLARLEHQNFLAL